MSYTRNFGIRSFENIVRDGRNKTPATGSPYLIGTAVQVGAGNVLVRPAASTAPTALSGIVLYEHIQFQGVDPFLTSPQDFPFTVVPLGRYAQMIHGLGVKVFFKNTTSKPLYDGRVQPGALLVTSGGATPTAVNPNVGDFLTPAADGTWLVGTSTNAWLQVEHVVASTGLVEARFTF